MDSKTSTSIKILVIGSILAIVFVSVGVWWIQHYMNGEQTSGVSSGGFNEEEAWDWDMEHHCHHLTSDQECENIEWPLKYGCRIVDEPACHTCFAQLNKDASICEKIGEQFWRDNCYWAVVVELNKAGLENKINFCQKIEDGARRRACLETAQ